MKLALISLKRTVVAATLGVTLGISAASAAASEELITVRSMSIDSSIEEIESVMGPCADNHDDDDLYYCGNSDSNSFRLNQSGQIIELYVECEIFDGCDYDVEQLAYTLRDRMDSIQRLEIRDSGFMGDIATLTGKAGDILEIWDMDDGPLLIFRVGTARSPLMLD